MMSKLDEPPDNPGGETTLSDEELKRRAEASGAWTEAIGGPPKAPKDRSLSPVDAKGILLSVFCPDKALANFRASAKSAEDRLFDREGFPFAADAIAVLQLMADREFDFAHERVKRLDDRRGALVTLAFGLVAALPAAFKLFDDLPRISIVASFVAALLAAVVALLVRRTSTVPGPPSARGYVEGMKEKRTREKDEITISRLAATMEAEVGLVATMKLFAAQVNAVICALFFAAVVIGVSTCVPLFISAPKW